MRYLLFFISAIVISYSVSIAPRYVSVLSGGQLKFDGTIERFRTDCHRAAAGGMKCVDSYRVPRSIIAPYNERPLGVGLGIFISSTEIYCSNSDSHRIRYGDPSSASRALELLKTYEVANLTELHCNGDLIVDVWNPPSYRRAGFVGGSFVIGNANYVQQVKRVVEFCTSDFYLLLGFALWATLLITGFVIRPLTNKARTRDFFGLFSTAWVVFAITKSGIPEILLPVISTKLIYIRFANFFSGVAHLGPAVIALSSLSLISRCSGWLGWLGRPITKESKLRNLHILVALICLSPFFASWLGVMTLFAFAMSLIVGIRGGLLEFTLFSICALLESGKLFNVPGMPYGSTTLTFVSLVLFDRLIRQIRHGSVIGELLMWAKASTAIKSSDRIRTQLQEFGAKFNIGRLTVIEPKSDGHCKITVIYRSEANTWKTDEIYYESLPPVFSHVLTTQEGVWNIHEDSDLASNLRKGSPKKRVHAGNYFSVIPVMKELNPVGALALTDYPAELFDDEMHCEELKLGVRLVVPILAEEIWSESLSLSDVWYRKCLATSEAILSAADSEKKDFTATLTKIASIINASTGLSVFLSKVNPLSRELEAKATSGYSTAVGDMYRETRFYALDENTQGPMPLAVNRGRVVVVGDISWLFPVLHPFSLRILKASGCRSAAAVPIFFHHDGAGSAKEAQKTWGLLWLESRTVGEFSPNKEPGLRILAAAIESVVARVDYVNRAKGALEELVRSDVAQKLLLKVPVREEETGYLVVADIRGSTKIANAAGAEAWLQFISCIKGVLESIAEKYGLRLQFIIWDAFYFTTRSEAQHERAITQFLNFASEVNAALQTAFEKIFPEHPISEDGARARFCIEYGDITRDVSNGSWTITGSAMASASKLESACKGISGWFFFTESIPGSWSRSYETLRQVNPGTGMRIVRGTRKAEAIELSETLRTQLLGALTIFDGTRKRAA